MAPPNEILARSLTLLAQLQQAGKRALKGSDLPRMDRQRLVRAGFLQEVVRGWYLPGRPDEPKGSSAAWFAGMRDFIAGYCMERFASEWHVSPDQSLMLRSGERTLPRQVQVWAVDATNQPLELPHGCTLFLYKAPRLCEASEVSDAGGLRLAETAAALLAVGPGFFVRQPLAARIALASIQEPSGLLRPLLDGGHVHIAGRLAAGMRAIGRESVADEILSTMRAAGLDVRETQPFELPQTPLP